MRVEEDWQWYKLCVRTSQHAIGSAKLCDFGWTEVNKVSQYPRARV